jgi:uncharacterized protein (TIGR02391 family)
MARLDSDLLAKMVAKTKRDKQYLREQISRRASRHLISSPAAQIQWARELGIGVAVAMRRAEPSVREELSRAHSAATAIPSGRNGQKPQRSSSKKEPNLGAAIDFILQDADLKGRCRDLLLAKRHYDRVLREATTVLDDRLKTVSGIKNMNPGNLIGKALSPDPNKAVIVVSKEADEQEGFFNICKGVSLTFRNQAHHNLSSAFTQADALKFCGFIDTLLGLIGKGTVHPERI